MDFDGVLNSNRYFDSASFKRETMGMDWNEIMLIAHHTHLDHKGIQLVNQLIDRRNAFLEESGSDERVQVVVSSTWRLHYTIDELNAMLIDRGSTFAIVDKTPSHNHHYGWGSWMLNGGIRGNEIQEYLDGVPEPVQFVILDDIDNMLHLSNHLVLTDEAVGVTDKDIEKALQILSEE